MALARHVFFPVLHSRHFASFSASEHSLVHVTAWRCRETARTRAVLSALDRSRYPLCCARAQRNYGRAWTHSRKVCVTLAIIPPFIPFCAKCIRIHCSNDMIMCYGCRHIGLRWKAAMTTAIFDKAYSVDFLGASKDGAASLINLISVDVLVCDSVLFVPIPMYRN